MMGKEKEDQQYFSFNKKAIKLHCSSCSACCFIKQIMLCSFTHERKPPKRKASSIVNTGIVKVKVIIHTFHCDHQVYIITELKFHIYTHNNRIQPYIIYTCIAIHTSAAAEAARKKTYVFSCVFYSI